jgi:hypothetical protein
VADLRAAEIGPRVGDELGRRARDLAQLQPPRDRVEVRVALLEHALILAQLQRSLERPRRVRVAGFDLQVADEG